MTTNIEITSKEQLLSEDKYICEQTIVQSSDGFKYKGINVVTNIDRVGKIEAEFVVVSNKGNYRTMYLDKAIEEYNKIII